MLGRTTTQDRVLLNEGAVSTSKQRVSTCGIFNVDPSLEDIKIIVMGEASFR